MSDLSGSSQFATAVASRDGGDAAPVQVGGVAYPQSDPNEIARALDVLFPCLGDVLELRCPTLGGQTLGGFYRDRQKLIRDACNQVGRNAYVVLNKLKANGDFLERVEKRLDRFGAFAKGESTSDGDVERREWLPVDLDRAKEAGDHRSAAEDEHAAACSKAIVIRDSLVAHGFPEPLFADSGNGAHLLLKIDLPNTPESTALVKGFLTKLKSQFDDLAGCLPRIEVDTTVHNASRIFKLYGTVARKGDHTAERPHRQSKLLSVPDHIETVSRELLESYVGPIEVPPTTNHHATVPYRNEEPLLPVESVNGNDRFDECMGKMLEHSSKHEDGYDGSNRCISLVRIGNSCGLSESRVAEAIRKVATMYPFPATFDGNIERRIRDSLAKYGRGPATQLPKVELPGGAQTITHTATQLGTLIAAAEHKYFNRGDVPTRVAAVPGLDKIILKAVKPAEAQSGFERVAKLMKTRVVKGEKEVTEQRCSKSDADAIISSTAFLSALPPLNVLSRCPLLIERGGALVVVSGYDRESGIMADGVAPEVVSLNEARELLHDSLSGFRFATSADKSRALAAQLAPAFVLGGLLRGRAPIDVGEANLSQTGKGYRNKITGRIYRQTIASITTRRSGVGGLEESFSNALIDGSPFIEFDNIRGAVDSPAVESFLTQDSFSARAPHKSIVIIDPRRTVLMFTSNKADMTVDLVNRSSCVRILKQPDGFQFPTFPEGDILAHVEANQPRYLGAVFTIIKAWHAAGKPRTDETRHDFREWAQTLDWIVQNLLGAVPLMDGHRETQERIANPALNWMRDVGMAVCKQKRSRDWLLAADIFEVIEADGKIEVPGLRGDWEECSGDDDSSMRKREAQEKAVLQQIGKRLKRAFGDAEWIIVDGIKVSHKEWIDDDSRKRHQYRFERLLNANADYPNSPEEDD